MDNILTKLESISELSEDELKALKESVFSEYQSIKPSEDTAYTVEIVDNLNQLADAKDAIDAELANRVQLAAELAAAAEAATSRLDAEEESVEDAEATPEEAPAEDEADKAEDEAEEAAEEPEAEEAEDAKEDDKDDEDKDKVGEFSTETPAAVETASEPEAEEAVVEPATKEPLEGAETEDAKEDADASTEVAEDANDENPSSAEDKESEAPATTPESSEEPVTASNINNFSAPEENAPVVPAKAVRTITAGAEFDGIRVGTQLSSLQQVAQGIVSKRHGLSRASGAEGDYHTIATFNTAYPEDRVLNRTDAEGNKAKIDAIVSPEAIVAAGGLTAPVETTYDIFELGETDARPVRDSLPKFNAERGGIRFLTSPTMDDLDGSVSVWTLQDDIDAASADAPNPTKPCIRVNAGEEVEVFVDAIPLCLTFGNLQTRAYPELVERHIKLGMVWHARFAETRLLTRIGQLSKNVSASAELGAARDILVQVEAAAAGYRNRYRLDSNHNLRVMFPEWFRNALRADLIKELPGNGRDGTFNLGEAEINSWFAARNIVVTWFIDGEEGQIMGEQAGTAGQANTNGKRTNPGARAGTDQTNPAAGLAVAGQNGTAVELNSFPSTLVWYLFSEGTFLFLDAGTLDLGLVRDSTLNGTNDYKIFLETFEGVAKVGIESLRITSELRLIGATSGTVDLAGAGATAPAPGAGTGE